MEKYPELHNLIPRGIVVKDCKGSRKDSEDKKLELRLGPPGLDQPILSSCHGAKRGFQDTIEAKAGEKNWNNKLSFTEKPTARMCIYPWSSFPVLPFPSSSAYHEEQSHKQSSMPNPSLLLSSSLSPSTFASKVEESTQPNNSKVAELHCPEKKLCSVPATKAEKRNGVAAIVGWPPIRSNRKNLASINSSKLAPESSNEIPKQVSGGKKSEDLENSLFVKIKMDGVPIGRKVDVKAYDNYEKLSSAVNELFRGLLKAQNNSCAALIENESDETKDIVGSLDGTGVYTLVYEDNEGDRMLVGDVPWHMFVSSVKRLRVLKKSELPALHLNSSKLEKTSLASATKSVGG